MPPQRGVDNRRGRIVASELLSVVDDKSVASGVEEVRL